MDWLTTLHAMTVLVVVEGLIRWTPLPRLSRLLGVRVNLEPAPDDVELFPVEQLPAVARRQLRGARRVTDVWPLSKGPCLRRSLVAGHLLRRYRPAVRIGVTGSGDELVAHAWIEIDDRPFERVDAYRPFQHHPVSSSP
jgi:hypothetical protein